MYGRVIACVLALAAVTAATPVVVHETGNADNYTDMVLDNLNELLPARIDLPDSGDSIKLTNCYLWGLDSGLYRDGEATFVTVDKTSKYTSALATHETGITCDWQYLFDGGKATGSSDKISLENGVEWHLVSGQSPVVTELRVTDMAKVQVDISGLTPLLNWLGNDIAESVINSYAEAMEYYLENDVVDMLNDYLTKYTIP